MKLTEGQRMKKLANINEGKANPSSAAKGWVAYLWGAIDDSFSDLISNGDHGVDDFMSEMGYDLDGDDYYDENAPRDKALDLAIAAHKAAEKAFKAALTASAKKFPVGPSDK